MSDSAELVRQLALALERNESIVTVHYACESILTVKDHPPGVACIAVYDLSTREISSFSRSDSPAGVEPDDLEKDMLERFFGRLAEYQDAHVVHWNMNRPEYGFEALLSRYRSITESTQAQQFPRRRIDLDDLLVTLYGENYAPHGRLQSMANLNDLDVRSFVAGKEEADLFNQGDWSTLSRSSASKSKIVGELLRKLTNGTLRTASSAGITGFAGSRLDAVKTVCAISQRFLLVQRSLRKHPHGGTVISFENEWDDQYLFKALLKLFFDDIRDEDYVPSYAGSNSRVDYLLPEYRIAVELKHASENLSDSDIGEELLVDKGRYQSNTAIDHLICIVFDPDGWLDNPRGLERDLQNTVSEPGMAVTVQILDR